MTRKSEALKRKGPTFKAQPTVLVICEDLQSSRKYFQDVAFHFRIKVDVTHCGKTDPKNIVIEAIRNKNKYDHVFCAIDRDTHETFDEAMRLIRAEPKITPIVSYPCFEYWLLLHFGPCRKPYASSGNRSAADNLIEDLRTYEGMENYAKGEVKDLFKSLRGSKFQEARKQGPLMLNAAIADDELNPSTRLHELIAFFEKISTLEPL